MARSVSEQTAMSGGVSMSARPTTKTNGYSGMSAANVTEAQMSRPQKQYSCLEVMTIELPAVMQACGVSYHLLLYSSFVRTDTLAPDLACRITVAMMGWRRRSANVAKSRSNSR